MWLKKLASGYLKNYAGITLFCWENIFLTLLSSIVTTITFFIAAYFVGILNFSASSVGLLMSSYGVGTILGGIITGKLINRAPAISMAMVSSIGEAVIFFCFLHLSSCFALAIGMFLFGFFSYGFKTINSLLIMQGSHSQDDQSKAINTQYATINLGVMVSAIIFGTIVDRYGFKFIFYFFGALSLYAALHLWSLQKRNPEFRVNTINSKKEKSINNPDKTNATILCITFSIVFLTGLVIAQLGTTYVIFLHKHFSGYGVKIISFMYIINTAIVILFQTPLVNHFLKINRMTMLGFGAGCYSLGMFFLAFVNSLWMLIFACIIQTIGEIFFYAVAQMICYQNASNRQKGIVLGIFQTTFAISVATGPFLGASIYHHMGEQVVWYVCGVIGILSVVLSGCARYLKF